MWQKDIEDWKAERKRIVPENTMTAFCMAVKHGFGSELDVHLAKDGSLPVFHDENLFRMCGVDGKIEDLTKERIGELKLLDTDCRIPFLEQVLDLYTSPAAACARPDGRCGGGAVEGNSCEDRLHLPLIIELKAEKNAAALCAAVMECIDRYPSLNYCIESFDPRVTLWLKKNRPDVIRGQLTENFCRSKEAVAQWGRILTFGMWCGATDIITRPDFISSRYRDRRNFIMRLRHRMGTGQVNWTIRNHRQLERVDQEGGLSIFERFIPAKGPAPDR